MIRTVDLVLPYFLRVTNSFFLACWIFYLNFRFKREMFYAILVLLIMQACTSHDNHL
jgi:hypothetical protein